MIAPQNLSEYVPILLFLGIGLFLATALILVSWKRGTSQGYNKGLDHNKLRTYECGFDAFGEETFRKPFRLHFYRVAILFILFDVEIVFLFPWALTLREISPFGFWSVMFFLFIVTIGFVYEWFCKGLEWDD